MRPLRIRMPNMTYYTQSRCHNRKDFMTDDEMKDMMEEVLIEAQKKYKFELIGYDIHDTEFHFLIRTLPKQADISRIMQYIKSRYALRYNKLMNRVGAYWNERFADIIVENEEEPEAFFLWLLWFLAYLPVRRKKAKNPRDYKYQTINIYLGIETNPRVQITLHKYFIGLGRTLEKRIKKFMQYEDIYRRRLCLSFL